MHTPWLKRLQHLAGWELSLFPQKPTTSTGSFAKSNNTSCGALQHQLVSVCAALPVGCRTRGICGVGGSCPQLPARMEIPESSTRGAEQMGTVFTQFSLSRLYCNFFSHAHGRQSLEETYFCKRCDI